MPRSTDGLHCQRAKSTAFWDLAPNALPALSTLLLSPHACCSLGTLPIPATGPLLSPS